MRGRPAGAGTDESSRDEWIRSRGGRNKRIGEKGKRKKKTRAILTFYNLNLTSEVFADFFTF
jgi:hypothetical protein